MSDHRLIIGIGNCFRRDDGVGPRVAERLRDYGLPTLELSGEGAGLIEAWSAAGRVVVVDAVASGAAPGTLYRFDAVQTELPRRVLRASSHLFGLAEAVATARALGRLPPELIVHGVEGDDFGFGDELSPEVAKAAEILALRIAEEFS